jgi:hypothetical protein
MSDLIPHTTDRLGLPQKHASFSISIVFWTPSYTTYDIISAHAMRQHAVISRFPSFHGG